MEFLKQLKRSLFGSFRLFGGKTKRRSSGPSKPRNGKNHKSGFLGRPARVRSEKFSRKLKRRDSGRSKVKRVIKKKVVSKPRVKIQKSHASLAGRNGNGARDNKTSRAKVPLRKPALPGDLRGEVTHYFPKVRAAVVRVRKGAICIGDVLYFKGAQTDFKQ